MALKLTIPDRISQLDDLNDEQLKEMLDNPKMIQIFATDVAATLCEMRQHQQAEILRIAKSNLENKNNIETIMNTNNELRNEVDTLTAIYNSLKQRRDDVLKVFNLTLFIISLDSSFEIITKYTFMTIEIFARKSQCYV